MLRMSEIGSIIPFDFSAFDNVIHVDAVIQFVENRFSFCFDIQNYLSFFRKLHFSE